MNRVFDSMRLGRTFHLFAAIILLFGSNADAFAVRSIGSDDFETLKRKIFDAQGNIAKALDRKQFETAFLECSKTIPLLEAFAPLCKEESVRSFVVGFIASEKNRLIIIAWQAIAKDAHSQDNLSEKWRGRIGAMAAPQDVDTSWGLVNADWKVFVCYGVLQQGMALYYILLERKRLFPRELASGAWRNVLREIRRRGSRGNAG